MALGGINHVESIFSRILVYNLYYIVNNYFYIEYNFTDPLSAKSPCTNKIVSLKQGLQIEINYKCFIDHPAAACGIGYKF